jgi:hypothetical protein
MRFAGNVFFISPAIRMEISASGELLADLFEEYSEWYSNLANENGVLPRSISGVSEGGRQFIYLIDDLELHHMVRNKYIRFVLEEQQAVAYAYGGLALRGDSEAGEIEEVLDVVAADSKHYIMGQWRVVRGDGGKVVDLRHMGTREGDDPEKQPGSWFLSGSLRFTDHEKVKYGSIWEAAKPKVIFTDRNADE